MKVTVYQMILELNFEGLLFAGLSQLKRHGYDEPPAERYETVFSGNVDAENLEDVYRFFNRVTAEDEKRLEALNYRGRSLSVSDVVEVFDINDESRFYYCDMFGFSEVKFQKNKAVGSIQNHDDKLEQVIRTGNMRAFFMGDLGLENHCCSKIVLERCRYSQTQIGYRLKFWPPFSDHSRYLQREYLLRPTVLVTQFSFGCLSDSWIHRKIRSEMSPSHSSIHFIGSLQQIEQWCKAQRIQYEYL